MDQGSDQDSEDLEDLEDSGLQEQNLRVVRSAFSVDFLPSVVDSLLAAFREAQVLYLVAAFLEHLLPKYLFKFLVEVHHNSLPALVEVEMEEMEGTEGMEETEGAEEMAEMAEMAEMVEMAEMEGTLEEGAVTAAAATTVVTPPNLLSKQNVLVRCRMISNTV